MARLTVLAVVVLGACLVLTTTAHAEPNVRTASLDCDSNPETVIIHNLGDETQSMRGWELRSDPDQVFDLNGKRRPGTASHCGALGLESKEGSSCADG